MEDLDYHKLLEHAEGQSITCEKCGEAFQNKSEFIIHECKYSREKFQTCPVCGMKFLLLSQLCKHIKSHNRKLPFKCKYCDREFLYRVSLMCVIGL